MLLALLILSVALALSGIAAYYSIIGLTAIFAAAVIPIIVMGGVLEVAKLTVTVWLHQNWQRAKWIMKSYLVSAVAVLMFITSMGIFGFLSKSHIEQSALGTEQVAQVKVIDDKLIRAQAKVQRWTDEIGRLNRGETSGRVDGLIKREQARIVTANTRIQPQIDAENAKVKGLRDQAAIEVEQQNKRLGDAQKRTNADIQLAEKRLAQLDKDVAAYTSQGTTTGGVFTADVDNVKKGNQLRASQKPERDNLNKAIQQAKSTEIGVASRVQREITKINTRLADQIKAVGVVVANIRKSIDPTIESANTNIAKYTLEAGSANKNIDQRIKELELNIENTQPEIDGLREEKFVFEKQYRQFEAEVGPVKYIAQLIYGDDPDQNLLESAVRWVIILIVAVFDPLAIMMLLAATETFAWRRQDKELKDATIETLPSPLPLEENTEEPAEEAVAEPESEQPISDEKSDAEPAVVREEDIEPRIETGADIQEPAKNNKEHVTLHVEHIVLPEPDKEIIDNTREWQELYGDVVPAPVVFDEPDYVELDIEEVETPKVIDEAPIISAADLVEQHNEEEDNPEKRAKRIWKRLNTEDTLKNQEAMESAGVIEEVPWQQYIEASEEDLEQFTKSNFGTVFPTNSIKGDTFVRVDTLPTKLYRWNNTAWIEINKDTTDTYSYNDEYIAYLIEKLGSGEYDPELLNDTERSQIEQQLKSQDL